MELKKQDKNGIRRASEIPQRYNLGQIKTVVKEIQTLKETNITVDRELSEISTNPVQNKTLNAKFDEINEILQNIIKSISLDGSVQTIDENNNVNIQTIMEMNITDSKGYIWFSSGLLIQWGKVLLEEESLEVLFSLEYDNIPFIEAVPYSNSVVNFFINNLENAKEGLVINSEISSNFGWKAIGYKNPIQEISREEEKNG